MGTLYPLILCEADDILPQDIYKMRLIVIPLMITIILQLVPPLWSIPVFDIIPNTATEKSSLSSTSRISISTNSGSSSTFNEEIRDRVRRLRKLFKRRKTGRGRRDNP